MRLAGDASARTLSGSASGSSSSSGRGVRLGCDGILRSIANESPSCARKIRPIPTPTDASIAWRPKPNAMPDALGDAVLRERQRDRRLDEPDVPGPEREDRRDVHQHEHEAGGRQRRVDPERPHRDVDREQLEQPAEALEERGDRGGERRAEHAEPLPRHRHEPPNRALRRLICGLLYLRAAATPTASRTTAEAANRVRLQVAQPGIFAVASTHSTRAERGHEVEQPVREHGADERRPEPGRAAASAG